MRAKWLALLIAGAGVMGAATAWGDVLYFQDGESLHGRLSRVTGELIEFQAGGSTVRFWERRLKTVRRLQLGSRWDRVETRTGETQVGEIFYVDAFNVELRTPDGNLRIPRLLVRDIVLGAPDNLPESPAGGTQDGMAEPPAGNPMAEPAEPFLPNASPPLPGQASEAPLRPAQAPGVRENDRAFRQEPGPEGRKSPQTGRPMVVFPSASSGR
jgi:hypothetical protein